jgi:hypothetical protein
MHMVAAWEEFVQGCFIRYMTGAVSPSNYAPALRVGPCQTLSHAGQVLTRKSGFDFESEFIGWSTWSEVGNRAKIFFAHGRPFSSITNLRRQRLADAFVIRNRVAHSSKKCRVEFLQTAKLHLGLPLIGRLRQGYDVGTLLLERPQLFKGVYAPDIYFKAYVDLFVDLADVIAP